jgi:hypothetical protein
MNMLPELRAYGIQIPEVQNQQELDGLLKILESVPGVEKAEPRSRAKVF